MKYSALALLMISTAWAADPVTLSPELSQVLSRVQAMGHGTASEKEWLAAQADLDRLVGTAEQAGHWNDALEATLVKAMMQADVRRDYAGALDTLQQARKRYEPYHPASMRKVFVREAQAYGSLGDDASVRRVMEEFKASSYYDPEYYSYVAHEGRNTPLTIVRPSAGASDSIALTAMRVARQQSKSAPGTLFPEFTLTDVHGHERKLADYRGKVLLVDFWVRGWAPWQRDLENLRRLQLQYGRDGFEILGVCLEPNATDLAQYAAGQGMVWPQVADASALTRALGIFGTAGNYLVNRDGLVVARNVRGADLAALVRKSLAE